MALKRRQGDRGRRARSRCSARPGRCALTASRFNCYLSPLLNRQVCGGDFETTIERSQWGVTWGIPFGFEDRVRLLVQVEAVNVR